MNTTIWPLASAISLSTAFEPVLEFAAVLGARDHRADVERHQPAITQTLGDVAVDDPLGETLDDRRLAHARLADQDGVVLGPAAEDLDHAADLVVAPDHGVKLALGGRLGQVAAEALERLELVLRVLVGDAMAAAHLVERLEQLVAGGAGAAQCVARLPRMGGDGQHQVLGGDVLVAELAHLLLGRAQNLGELARSRPRLSASVSPLSVGSASSAGPSAWRTAAGSTPSLRRTGATMPPSCSSSTASRCSGVVCGLRRSSASRWAACIASWDLIVNRSGCIRA